MKVILFTGTHSRHLYVHEHVLKNFEVCGVVMMEREKEIPGKEIKGNTDTISKWSDSEQLLYKTHFDMRNQVESSVYGNRCADEYDFGCEVLRVSPERLNSEEVASFVKKQNADVCFIFGVNLIKNPVSSVLPKWKINLHLGLSPWYRGSATLFWPFYNLQPQYAGSTFHQIVDEPDAGDILHQSIPVLEYGDTMHETAAKVVVESAKDIVKLLTKIKNGEEVKTHKQKSSGKNFLIKDFQPHHLRLIYEMYSDKIVDEWLNGNLGSRKPKLIRGF